MKVKDFEDLVLTSQNVRGKLEDLGCFSKVGIHIDTSNTGNKDYTVTYQAIVDVLHITHGASVMCPPGQLCPARGFC